MLSLALLIHELYVTFVINPKLHIKRDHDKQGQFYDIFKSDNNLQSIQKLVIGTFHRPRV